MNKEPQLVASFGAFNDRQKLQFRGGGIQRIRSTHTYQDIISIENLLEAWKEFIKGKRKRTDIQEFEKYLMRNILALHADLVSGTYHHGGYEHFKIADPKPRDIHKASVRDRLLHHALYRKLYPLFETTFIPDSYSCRLGKGTHKAMNRFRAFAYRASKNDTRTCWVLKGDIRKFFASIDQCILLEILRRHISNERILSLLANIISSFNSGTPGKGLPLGNLTSQLLVNIYMNEFDQFVKHTVKAKHYIRYADDFVVLSHDREWLCKILLYIEAFLRDRLKLHLHPVKVSIKTFSSGIDFLGWVHFPNHRVLRTTTKWRMFRALSKEPKPARVFSYLGMLSHGSTRKLAAQISEPVGK